MPQTLPAYSKSLSKWQVGRGKTGTSLQISTKPRIDIGEELVSRHQKSSHSPNDSETD